MYEKWIEPMNKKAIELMERSLINEGTGCEMRFVGGDSPVIANGVTVQKWIPVTERLPEEYTTVLVCGEDGVEPGRFYGKSGFWTYDQYEQDPIFAVTHWMPLPEPPKGE